MAKRLFDIVCSVFGLIVFALPMILVAVMIKFDSPGPVLFRQRRVGLGGKDFFINKFRTMSVKSDAQSGSFDAGDASRVSRVGKVLRATKFDEFPQLINVLSGDMSLVGPRPEVRQWVELFPERWRLIHTVRPGVTDPASIAYRNEEEILRRAVDPIVTYRDEILPRKLAMYEDYVKNQSFAGDLKLLLVTVLAILAWKPAKDGAGKRPSY